MTRPPGRDPERRQRPTVVRRALLLFVALALAACGSSGGPPTSDTAQVTPEAAEFDVAAVRASFIDECNDPIVVDELFCEQVKIGEITGESDILTVPTTLNAAAGDRAAAICDQIAIAHFDADAVDLGYKYIGVKDQEGGDAAACSVS